tara:strand:- start:6978 stop:7730 length:753 start_codon:yes stop_codon:yes gene_type:complete
MEKYTLSEIKDEKELIIYHHLGIGDHIVCNGLVNFISENHRIHLPVKKKYSEMVQHLYSKNNKVNLFEIEEESEKEQVLQYSENNKLNILKIGFEKLSGEYNKSFYSQIGLDYKYSYDKFYVPEDIDKEVKIFNHLLDKYKIMNNSFIFIHNSSTKGVFKLKNLPKKDTIYMKQKDDIFNNIFFYRKVIIEAKEIHCVNSSFSTLIERLPTKGKLFFHDIIKREPVYLSNKWEVINYENKSRYFNWRISR